MFRHLQIFALVGLLAFLVMPEQNVPASLQSAAPREDSKCVSCHAEAGSYAHTAHRTTSSRADDSTLQPMFASAGNKLTITSAPLPTLSFLMEKKDGRYLETAVTGWGDDLARVSEPIDVVVGSGKRGQTYLSWSENRLYEMPVSFWTEGHRWINSPGYIDGTADFRRPVPAGCLECHVTAITPLSQDASASSYERESLITGISCKTCHGPSEAHVIAAREAAASHTRLAESAILNPAHFSRERKIDQCAVCHSGIQRVALMPAFSYVPGSPLTKYFEPLPGANQDRPDVHGNQVGLLERSRCFRSSTQMTCSTCHNVHTAGQPVEAYAKKCLTCHQWQSCGQAHRLGVSIQGKCIGCHMPLQQTSAIVSVTAGVQVQATMRTHWIKVYGSDSRGLPRQP